MRALSQENLTLLHMINKGANQPTHLRSLISAFVFHLLNSMIYKLYSCKISIFELGSVAELVGLGLEDRFPLDKTYMDTVRKSVDVICQQQCY